MRGNADLAYFEWPDPFRYGPKQKLYVFKFRAEWLVVDVPAGIVVCRCSAWAEALEAAQTTIDVREVCS